MSKNTLAGEEQRQMQRFDEKQLRQLSESIASPLFVAEKDTVRPLNTEAEALADAGVSLLPYLADGERLECREIPLKMGEEIRTCSLSGKKILLGDRECWLLQLVLLDAAASFRRIQKIALAQEIMLKVFSQIDKLDSEQEIYELILDNCGKAVEHPELCSLMIVKNHRAYIVAKRGFTDIVDNVSFDVKDTFLSLATDGKLDRIVIINELEKYWKQYYKDIKTERTGVYLASSLTAPIYVHGELYGIISFDSTRKNTFTDEDVQLLEIVKSNIQIILESYRMHAEIRRLSQTDVLTGLYNRTYLQEYLRKHIRLPFYIGMFDLNNLKKINDCHGHASGDMALREFASVLKAAFPAQDAFFRVGGDEFMCIVYSLDRSEIDSRITGMREHFRENALTLTDGCRLAVTFSCGFAPHEAGITSDLAAQQADAEMYADKMRYKKLSAGIRMNEDI